MDNNECEVYGHELQTAHCRNCGSPVNNECTECGEVFEPDPQEDWYFTGDCCDNPDPSLFTDEEF